MRSKSSKPMINGDANRQRGLALITVLFIFALVSMLAINMQQRQSLDIAQTSATLAQTQMQAFALSAEDLAKALLTLDMNRDHDNDQVWDTASEQWNMLPLVELDGAKVFVQVRDLQGLFNLNSLQSTDPQPRQRFQRLLTSLAVENAVQITSDLASRLAATSSPYSIPGAGILLTHPSELLSFESVTLDDYKKMQPFITALPITVSLNINTAPGEVLASWDNGLSLSDANTVINLSHAGSCGIAVRNDNVIKSVEDLWAHSNIKGLTTATPDNWQKHDFTVNSQYFAVLIQVEFDGQILMLESIIRREKGNFIGVIYRDFSKTAEDMDLKIIECGSYSS